MNQLESQVCVVTGAGSGIGRGIAEVFSEQGATVVVTDVNPDSASRTALDLGRPAIAITADVSDQASVNAMVLATIKQFGRIDVLVNNAGWDKPGPFLGSDPAQWDGIIRINLYGVLHGCWAVLPHMVRQGGGSVVNIGSDAGRVGSSGEAVYSAAKGGVIAFTKTMAREMARNRINVNCVCPGPADTPLLDSIGADNPDLRAALTKAIPMRRLAVPHDVAHAVAFLASPPARYITGQTLSVSGGLTMG